jgi:hypothetical protein
MSHCEPSRRQPGSWRKENGQALVLIALVFATLLIFVGLAVDVGQLFIYMGHLRRSVDAASLAAAAQYREGRALAEMTESAEQVMNLNGVEPSSVVVETCETNPGDPGLCFTPRRKLVRVVGELPVPMTFLMLIGIRDITISANAIGEAASMDVVLVIDISESMANDASMCDEDDDDGDDADDDGRPDGWCAGKSSIPAVDTDWDNYYADPSRCNPGDQCHPMAEAKEAANSFIDRVLDQPAELEADRLAIVTFSNGWETPSNSAGSRVVPVSASGWTNDHGTAEAAINGLEVYEPVDCASDPEFGPCRNYDSGDEDGNYLGFECPLFRETGDPASCTTTNIGGGLKLGGNMFAAEPREDALWVVVLLTDGAANASDRDDSHDYGYCPPSTWGPPFCRDADSSTRHEADDAEYDADDFARDMADFVGCYGTDPAASCEGLTGQGAVIFAIGLGDQVLQIYGADPVPHGVSLLRYIAAVGDDGDSATDPCLGLYDSASEWEEWCGNYYFSPTGEDLDLVFEDIASRIFTRIAH